MRRDHNSVSKTQMLQIVKLQQRVVWHGRTRTRFRFAFVRTIMPTCDAEQRLQQDQTRIEVAGKGDPPYLSLQFNCDAQIRRAIHGPTTH